MATLFFVRSDDDISEGESVLIATRIENVFDDLGFEIDVVDFEECE